MTKTESKCLVVLPHSRRSMAPLLCDCDLVLAGCQWRWFHHIVVWGML